MKKTVGVVATDQQLKRKGDKNVSDEFGKIFQSSLLYIENLIIATSE